MNSQAMAVLQRWAMFRFDLADTQIVLRYRDVAGRRFSFPLAEPSLPLFIIESLLRVVGPPIPRWGPHGNGPIPIAAYYSLPPFPELESLERWFLQQFDEGPLRDLVQPVKLSRARRINRPGFSLPLRILAHPEVFPQVQPIADQFWLRDPVVGEYGLQLVRAERELADELRAGSWDVLLVPEARTVSRLLRALPVHRRPRLLIAFDDHLPSLQGVAVLALPSDEPRFVPEAILAIVHDCPLHELVIQLRRLSPEERRIRLLADPRTNQALRMRDAYVRVRRDITRLRLRTGPSLGRGSLGIPSGAIWPGAGVRVPAGLPRHDALSRFELADPASLFEQETTGLAPLAQLRADLAQLGRPSSVRTRGIPERVDRRVDAALFRVDTDPFYQAVTPHTGLAAGARYDLRVHIGVPQPESLVEGEVTPIAGLLDAPDSPEGYQLTVSVQGKDFRVARPGNRQLLLPLTGSSDPVYFRVRAPRDPGNAELRICIYHRNHLIQSLLLEATVDHAETEGSGVRIAEEFSRTAGFTNLEGLQPRAVSIALNESPQGSHQIHIVGDNLREDLDLSASAFDQAVLALRSELRTRLLSGNRIRTFAPVNPGDPPQPLAAQAILGLARKGWQVYSALFDEAGAKLQTAFQRLAGSEDEKIQVVRLRTRSAFPWTLLYDWRLPQEIVGAPDPPVCLGTRLDANGTQVACGHDKASQAVCVRGFWGIRHLVEELLPQKGPAVSEVPRSSEHPVWVVSSPSVPEAADLAKSLNTALAAGIRPGPWTEQQVLNLLWQSPPVRPAVMILLGHLMMKPVVKQPNAPRIELNPGTDWFTLTGLQAQRQGAGPVWDDPRTILVIAACDSAATTDDTLNDFVTAFNSAGAAAIVGTQVEVGLPQAVEFAHEFTTALWRDNLGVAMHTVRNMIVQRGDPGGFLFQSFGDIDLRLQ